MKIRLTEFVSSCGGCAAKWDDDGLQGLLQALTSRPAPASSGVLVGLSPFDDAAVLSVPADEALVSTVDFFPAIVDDPEDFGAVAAANACSDIFAMGGRVAAGLAIARFPIEIPEEVVQATVLAAADVLAEARREAGRWAHDPDHGAHLRARGAGVRASGRDLAQGVAYAPVMR